MKISYRWLQDYVPTTTPPKELAEQIQLTSSVVDSLVSWSSTLEGLVVGHILEVSDHPNSTKLHLTKVDLGKQTAHIVCGAPNVQAGQWVVVALPGTTLFPMKGEAKKIEITEIRGETSQGMLCGYDEIGINLPSAGIITLEGSLKAGMPAAEALLVDDTVFDLEITPNRPDLLSYLGIAREISTFERRHLLEVPVSSLQGKTTDFSSFKLASVNHHLCSRFSALYIRNITIAPSPYWLQIRLLLSGIKPINNVVDVTNYVMLELGQPLHAYDGGLLQQSAANGWLGLRSAHHKESFQTLDGTTRILEEGDIVIVDGKDKIISLAGIMGGKDSEITDQTTTVVLESAVFNSSSIRRTSRRLGLRSEASLRFEKGLDPEQTITALKRATYLLQQISSVEVASPLADSYGRSKIERPRIHLSYTQLQQVLGVHISSAECRAILQKLGFHLSALTKSSFEVIPPSWRGDIQIPEDIIEELIRIWGYDRLPSTLPSGNIQPPQPNNTYELKKTIRHSLASDGFNECISLSLTSAKSIQKSGIKVETAIPISTPLSSETEYLLPSHLISFLQNASSVNLQVENMHLFEIGSIFTSPQKESIQASLLLRTKQNPEELFREIKAVLEQLARRLERPAFSYAKIEETEEKAYYFPGSSLSITIDGTVIGECGLIDNAIIKNWKIRSAPYLLFASLNLEALNKQAKLASRYRPLSPYPNIERDITLIIEETLPIATLETFLKNNQDQSITLGYQFEEIYRGKPLAEDKKSVTIHLVYNGMNKTLEDTQVNADIIRLSQEAQKSFTCLIA